MGQPVAPDFASQIDPTAYTLPGSQGLKTKLDQASTDIAGVHSDYTQVNALLGMLANGQGAMDSRAMGKGLTAGDETQYGQQELGASTNDPQSLGKALMRMGSKMSAAQAAQTAQAQGQQQIQAMQKAQQLKMAQAQARIDIYKQEQSIQSQKFEMQRGVKQASDGMELATMQLRNMFNAAVSTAKNSKDLADLKVQHDNFSQIMSYLGMGLGAASTAAAAGAAVSSASSAQDKSDYALASKYNAGSNAMQDSALSGMSQNLQRMNDSASYGGATPTSGPRSAESDFYNS